MHLREGEEILRTIKRHRTPFILKMLKIALIVIPIYIFLLYLGREVGASWIFLIFSLVTLFIGVIVALLSIDYLLDSLIITNKRVVWVNWKSPFKKEEHEAELPNVHDIETSERGILSNIFLFNYGLLEIKTYASKTIISFECCPSPEQVEHFILVQVEKLRSKVEVV